ncbi:Tetratricopeptide-like helical [Cynara cardunculus var. scolymus]|uniref:Tetratricopeptide-like helical n=1 Tax=Cynara cardunculus var. scolymus TaxID=59895 RepID=A0A118JX43_CYNCS|nr:Tetratricopeptide-like helical [Cynara cardunculus var. scolymus]
MAEARLPIVLQILRSYELRLLRCSLSHDQPLPTPQILTTSSPLQTSIDNLLQSIESGHYSKALASDYAAFLLNLNHSSSSYSDSIANCVSSFLIAENSDEDTSLRAFLVVAVAVSAFSAFIQSNVTGPPESLPPLLADAAKEDLEVWARNEVMSSGSDLLGKFSNLEYLVFAKLVLLRIREYLLSKDEQSNENSVFFPTCSWWLARVILIQQKLLDSHSSVLFEKLQELIPETSAHLGDFMKVSSYWKDTEEGILSDIVSMVHLEMGIIDFRYGRVDSSKSHFESANKASGLSLSVGGSLEDNNGGSVIFSNGSTSLKPVQQALILAQCLLIEKNTPHDEMQRWDMAPYIEAIDSQPASSFIIRRFCDLLRIRWEGTRSRTKERAILMMDKVVEGINESTPGVAARIHCCFGVDIPTIPTLRKEYADLLVSCGLIGEAVKIYENLELWDNVIFCYRLLEKRAAAVELINTRLLEKPNDPRLWCSLGDVTNQDSCYEKALEVSENKSVRAKRSLARSAYNRGEYEKSKLLWESAMALNSLYPDGWFALGAAALKARDVGKALDAFTRAVQLDPDNGEAWNNIACLHMTKKRSKEALIAFKEALKFKRDSWQMWENYSQVAVDNGNFGLALEATQKVLSITKNKRIDVKLLERIMVEIEGNNGDDCRENEQLTEMIGKVLQQIARNGGDGEIWGLFARWHKLKGDPTMCSEALLKQVRSYQGSELWKDKERFKKFAHASLELCKVYMEIGSQNGGGREVYAAEMHLKSTIKQAALKFSETEEFKELQAFLGKLQATVQARSVPSA